jgi:EAL and modified HD-GYP domain-containing signal transduction protein
MSFIAADVHDMSLFTQLQRERYHLFEGNFYSVPLPKGYNTLAPVKVNSIQLLNLIRNEDFEIDEVAKIVGQDPSLSISLLKFINSPYLGLSSRVKTIQHAVAMLGQKEVRKWVTTAVSGALASDKPDEITKLSLMRAKFAENLAPHFEMAIDAQSLFMMGLFSILDVVLDMPIEKALEIVAVSEKIADALINRGGDYGNIMMFITVYETANWNEVSRLMVINKIEPEQVFEAYIGAAQWYGSIMAAENQE